MFRLPSHLEEEKINECVNFVMLCYNYIIRSPNDVGRMVNFGKF